MSQNSDRDSGSPHDVELDQLVLHCLSRVDREGEFAIEEECARHPELGPRLRRRIGLLREAGLLGNVAHEGQFPEQLGDFKLLRRLGGGGMGVVYLAEQASLDRRVALKLIRPEHLYFPGARARFAREAQMIARLAHPGIVPVHTIGEASGIPYIAMELVDGVSLAAVLADFAQRDPARLRGADLLEALCARVGVDSQAGERTALPFAGNWFDVCAWIAREVAQALEHAHQRGVIHRDVKPSNVMLTPSGRVMLVDFGLANTVGADSLTRTGSQLGSLPYMAPEQVQGRAAEIGPRTDVYGLGVTLFECVALRRPYRDTDSSRLHAAILDGRPPSLSSLAAGVPRELETVTAVAMSPELARRYGSAADLARDLSHVLARESIEARPAGTLMRLRRWAERNPARAVAAGLATLIVVGGPLGFGIAQQHVAAREREFSDKLGVAKSDVERSNDELRTTNSELERKRADLAGALVRETDERERAQRNFDAALDAVDTMLTRVGDETLAWVPQMETVRRELLEDALAFYGRFAAEHGDEPQVRARRAATQRKLGSLRRDLGQLPAAREATLTAVETLRELERDDPHNREIRDALSEALAECSDVLVPLQEFEQAESIQRELIGRLKTAIDSEPDGALPQRKLLAATEQHLAFLLRDTARFKEAIEHAELAAAGLRELVAGAPEDASLQHRLGVALVTWANLGSYASPLVISEQRLLEAIKVLRAALARHPEHPPIRESLASGLGTLGWLLSGPEIEKGYKPAGPSAEAALREAIEINTALIAQYPLRTLYQTNIAGESTNLCIHLARTGHLDRARPFGERSVAAYEALLRLEPENADHHSHLGAALCNVAMIDLHQDVPAAPALEMIDRAITEQRAALAAEPRNAEFNRQTRQLHVCRVTALLKLARWRDTLEQLAEFETAFADSTARIWAVERRLECAALAGVDETLAESERALRRDVELDGAVERLRELVAGGYEPEKLATLDTLAPLRDHAGFRELVEAH